MTVVPVRKCEQVEYALLLVTKNVSEWSRHFSNIREDLKYFGKCFSGLMYDGGPSYEIWVSRVGIPRILEKI